MFISCGQCDVMITVLDSESSGPGLAVEIVLCS